MANVFHQPQFLPLEAGTEAVRGGGSAQAQALLPVLTPSLHPLLYSETNLLSRTPAALTSPVSLLSASECSEHISLLDYWKNLPHFPEKPLF